MKSALTKTLIILILIFIGAFLYWTISPLFINKIVEDQIPKVLLQESESKADENSPAPTESESFTIAHTPGHNASGNVRVIKNEAESFVRFEDYSGTNGPDLFVYLAKDLDAKEFINLGRAKGNQGNINYPVPADIDISEYKYVMTWCKTFGVLFDYAEIN